MDEKTKDSTLCLVLFLIGGFAFYEGWEIVALAEKPPFRIPAFRVNPGMLPVILGGLLFVFSAMHLFNTLRREPNPVSAFFAGLKKTISCIAASFSNPDFVSMLVSVIIMFVYCFFILGRTPFWVNGPLFLVALMLYLRAAKLWVIALTSTISVTLIILLFQTIFRTSMP